jgi:hypothetical protein
MEIKIENKHGTVKVSAYFEQRVGHQRRVRFYCQDALEYAKKYFPQLKLNPDEDSLVLTISNYKEPLAGTWKFHLMDDPLIFKDMADKFEENDLKVEGASVKISKKKNLKKDNGNEIINDD